MAKLWWALGIMVTVVLGGTIFGSMLGNSYKAHMAAAKTISEEQSARHDPSYRRDEQERELRAAVRIAESSFLIFGPGCCDALWQLASCYQSAHKYGKAVVVWQKACAYNGSYEYHLADALVRDGRYHEAEALFLRDLATCERAAQSPYDSSVSYALMRLGKFYQQQSRWVLSKPVLERAVDNCTHNLDQAKRDAQPFPKRWLYQYIQRKKLCAQRLYMALEMYSATLSHLDKPSEAAQVQRQAHQLSEAYGGF